MIMNMVCDYKKCTGCGMCADLCSRNAIVMKEGPNDFVYPYINEKLCIDCGLCYSKNLQSSGHIVEVNELLK